MMAIIRRVCLLPYRALRKLVCLGICKISCFFRYKNHLLSTWHDCGKRSNLDDLLYPCFFDTWVTFEYLKEQDPNKRELLKGLAMGGVSGRKWASTYDSRPLDFNSMVGHMTMHEACPIYDEIDDICQNTQRGLVVLQIGSSSGREIAHFAAKFPDAECIGTDIYEQVIAYSSAAHSLPNLSFTLSSADSISQILIQKKGKNILVYASSSLQYVQPEHLRAFFTALAGFSNVEVVLLETADESQGNPDGLNRSIWRANFSYTHDYRYYAEESGLETRKCEIIRPYFPYEDFPVHKNTVHYFYCGKSNLQK